MRHDRAGAACLFGLKYAAQAKHFKLFPIEESVLVVGGYALKSMHSSSVILHKRQHVISQNLQ